MARTYLERCEERNEQPDVALLAPIVARLPEIQGEAEPKRDMEVASDLLYFGRRWDDGASITAA